MKDKKCGLKPQVELSYYLRKEYDSKGRFVSYWHQIDEITVLEPDMVLEIGIGNRFVANYLMQRGFNVTTMDIDEHLNPDKVGSVLSIPFSDKSFEVVACFEVLEHLPYDKLSKALSEIYRISNRYAIISLPDSTRAYRFDIQVPKIGELKKLITIPRLKPPKHYFDGEHYWEIGAVGYPLRRILTEMQNAGYKIEKTYRVFEIPYHRFFVLAKGEMLADA